MFLPKARTIKICGISVPVDPDFRIMCDYAAAVSKHDTAAMKNTAERFYFAGLPEGVSEKAAGNGMTEFYTSGFIAKYERKNESTSMKTPVPLFDFVEDEAYFYADFLAHYHIDLTTAKLHWLDFCALFRGLPDECRLKRIISVRAADLSKITSKAERSRIKKLKEIHALRCNAKKRYRNIAERNAAMINDIRRIHDEARQMTEGSDSL